MLRRHNSATNLEPGEIIFEADENLFQAPSMRVVMLAGSQSSLPITKTPRSFQSYVNEMCGKLGLASNTLRF